MTCALRFNGGESILRHVKETKVVLNSSEEQMRSYHPCVIFTFSRFDTLLGENYLKFLTGLT